MPKKNDNHLTKLVLNGYKSIKNCELEMRPRNVLIGANGSGKSNLLSLFKMIPQMLKGDLQRYISRQGGPDRLLHFGRKKTSCLNIDLYFGNNGYKCSLEPTLDNRMMFSNESLYWNSRHGNDTQLGTGHFESRIKEATHTRISEYVLQAMSSWRLYHFHDTSDTAKVKQKHEVGDFEYLREDASNLASFLNHLKNKYNKNYMHIVKTIQLCAPFFSDFFLKSDPDNKNSIELRWTQRDEDLPFNASQLSDGTLRFICLTTLLLQPEELIKADTILIDEPELGLHPYAIEVLSSLIKMISQNKQIIVSTQSVELLNHFEATDIIVADMNENKTQLKRCTNEELAPWLEEYSLGEIWKKNIIGGRPSL